jgi:UDP-N-acetylglucosamine 2-epimerase
MTCHRAANTDQIENLEQILLAVNQLDQPVIWPMHPRTRNAIDQAGWWDSLESDQVIITSPLGFWDLQSLLAHSKMVLTDSGGIIKEAYYHQVPGIIMDEQTEWVETVKEGWNQIAGADADRILRAVQEFKRPAGHTNCLGDGTAAKQIVNIIDQYFEYVE